MPGNGFLSVTMDIGLASSGLYALPALTLAVVSSLPAVCPLFGGDMMCLCVRVRPFRQIASRASREVQIDRSVWKAYENMPLKNVYLLFANLRCIRLFVVAGDRLTGVISRSILYKVRCRIQPA